MPMSAAWARVHLNKCLIVRPPPPQQRYASSIILWTAVPSDKPSNPRIYYSMFRHCNSSSYLYLKQHAPKSPKHSWILTLFSAFQLFVNEIFIQPPFSVEILPRSTEPWLPLYITWLHDCGKQKEKKENHFRSALRPWCSVTTETTNLCTLERERRGETERGGRAALCIAMRERERQGSKCIHNTWCCSPIC